MIRRHAPMAFFDNRAAPIAIRRHGPPALLLFVLSLATCARHPPTAGSQPSAPHGGTSAASRSAQVDGPILKIAVMRDGRLFVDGTITQLPALRESLRRLQGQKGCVYYYREAGREKPPPIAMEVMQAIIDARLPIRLSTRPDYSDSLGPL